MEDASTKKRSAEAEAAALQQKLSKKARKEARKNAGEDKGSQDSRAAATAAFLQAREQAEADKEAAAAAKRAEKEARQEAEAKRSQNKERSQKKEKKPSKSGDSGGGKHAGDWTCETCGASVFGSRSTCFKCGAPGGTTKPGDWPCLSCGANVFASKTACFKCGTPKGESGSGGGSGGGSVPAAGQAKKVAALPDSGFVDFQATCKECGNEFTVTAGAQQFFKDKFGSDSVCVRTRCKTCTNAKKQRYGERCASCSHRTTTPPHPPALVRFAEPVPRARARLPVSAYRWCRKRWQRKRRGGVCHGEML